jgi:asparaginyl-tRNA synthetase
LAYATHRFF